MSSTTGIRKYTLIGVFGILSLLALAQLAMTLYSWGLANPRMRALEEELSNQTQQLNRYSGAMAQLFTSQEQCESLTAKSLGLQTPVKASVVGLDIYHTFAYQSTQCLWAYLRSASGKDDALYQPAAGSLMYQVVKRSALAASAINRKEDLTRIQMLLPQLDEFMQQAYAKSDPFWTQYYQVQISIKESQSIGWMNFSTAPIEQNFSEYRQTREQTKQTVESIRNDILNPAAVLDKMDSTS